MPTPHRSSAGAVGSATCFPSDATQRLGREGQGVRAAPRCRPCTGAVAGLPQGPDNTRLLLLFAVQRVVGSHLPSRVCKGDFGTQRRALQRSSAGSWRAARARAQVSTLRQREESPARSALAQLRRSRRDVAQPGCVCPCRGPTQPHVRRCVRAAPALSPGATL